MKKILSLVLLTLLLSCQSGFSLDLQTAKAQGLVGETVTGYLAVVKDGNAATDQLASSINAKRKQQYQKIAKKNKTSLQAVEQLAGKKAIAKTPPGQFIKMNGGWKKK